MRFIENFSAQFADHEIEIMYCSRLRKVAAVKAHINPMRKVQFSKMRSSAIILFGFVFCHGGFDWIDSSCP